MGELVVGEAGLFGAEEEGYAGHGDDLLGFVAFPCLRIETWGARVLRGRRELGLVGGGEGGEEEGGGLLEGEDGLFELALADGGGGDDEGAVGDGGGEGVVAAGVGHDVLRGDGG